MKVKLQKAPWRLSVFWNIVMCLYITDPGSVLILNVTNISVRALIRRQLSAWGIRLDTALLVKKTVSGRQQFSQFVYFSLADL